MGRMQTQTLTVRLTPEEKKALEKVTGFAYDALWKTENAGLKR